MVHKMKAEQIPMWRLKMMNEEAGKFFFSRDTMRFFDSKLSPYAYKKGNYAYFISSEQFHAPETEYHPTYSAPRKYTIRKMNLKSGDVTGVGEFQEFSSNEEARAKLKKILEG